MAHLESLLNDLANLDAQHDLDGLRRVREQIAIEHPGSDAAAEALYKIGLDVLFRERSLSQAVDRFVEAAKSKNPFWSAAARTSLGLCYYHQKRTQKALFELRRVAYPETPSVHSVTALGFIETIYDAQGNREEARRARRDRMAQLRKLVQPTQRELNPLERGHFLFQLAVALKDDGDDAEAEKILRQAKAMGPDLLGADLYRAVVDLTT